MKSSRYFALPLLFIASLVAHAQSSGALSGLDRTLQSCQRQVLSWQHQATTELVLAVIIAVLGGLVSLLQKSDQQLAKRITIGLGIAIMVLTAVNSRVFLADDRTLRRAAFDGNAVINELFIMSDDMKNSPPADENHAALKSEYLKKLAEFHAIGEKLNGTAPSKQIVARSFSIIPRVYASSESPVPVWVKQPPPNGSTIFFVGKASDSSLAKAQQASHDAAVSRAVQVLRSKAPNASEPDFRALIEKSSLQQDSAFIFDKRTGAYTYYTLLRLSSDVENIAQSLPAARDVRSAPVKFQNGNWQPSDLAAHRASGLFALSRDGQVFRLRSDISRPQKSPVPERLFRIPYSYRPIALAASADAVYVAANSHIGCVAFRYTLATHSTAHRLVASHEPCAGIATDGAQLYVTFPLRKEIGAFDWASTSVKRWPLESSDAPGYIAFDGYDHRLIVADASGNAYIVSTTDARSHLFASNLGSVSSIAPSRFHIVIGSGDRVLFRARSDGSGESPPAGLQALTGGRIAGVAVDASDALWFADYTNNIVVGSFPLS